MAENLTETKPTTKNEITELINALSPSSNQDQSYHRHKVNYNQVLHEIKPIHSGCSTGTNNIPINLIKIVTEEIASPLTEAIHNSNILSF